MTIQAPARIATGPRLLFVYGGMTGFVERDLRYLAERFPTEAIEVRTAFPPIWRIAQRVHSADAVYCWFAGRHALIPVLLARLMRRRIVLVAGGYDVACEPAIDYGSMRPSLRKLLVRLILSVADIVVCISHSNRDEAIRNAGVPPAKIRLVRHGFSDTAAGTAAPKERIVLTVGEVMRDNLKRKGLEIFAKASRLVPDAKWIIAGRKIDGTADLLAEMGGENLEITGYLSRAALVDLMRRAKVYVQASHHEGFGCSLAEAMIERCIPVVTRRGALPEVVGAAGRFVAADAESTAREVSAALAADKSEGDAARARILSEFSDAAWQQAMDAVFSELVMR